jgi:hypothetical protein
MKTRLLLIGLLALVLVASGAATTHSTGRLGRQSSCPTVAKGSGGQGIRTTAQVVAAVRRGVPRIFRDFTTQGEGPGWHHYQVLGLFSLNGGYYPEVRGIASYRREALHRCGRAVALTSWVTFLQFPEAPMASASFAHMFVAKTPHGWVAW